MANLNQILSILGLTKENGLYFTSENRWKTETSLPNRIKRLIEQKIEPEAFFCFDNKPMVLFFDNPKNKTEIHKAIWNFNESPIAIFITDQSIEIFNGFNFIKEKNTLEKLGDFDTLNDFKYFELVTGKTWEKYSEKVCYKNRVDYHLLQNIKAAREILLDGNEERAKLSNAILGKVIFVRYLIDRKVKMKFDGKLRTWTNEQFCDLLDDPQKIRKFFAYIEDKKKGFNGDLFPMTANDYRQIRKSDYQVLQRLLLSEDISKNQPSLFQLYDFSIIPIEFISNVYELFIGHESQKQEGAYYTPLFLVDYMLNETVEKHLSTANNFIGDNDKNVLKRSERYSLCKVLDPACGSGIFLVESLRKIIEKYIAVTSINIRSSSFKTALKNLAKENIYGIDKDLSAVQVAIFSIYLTLLDYLEPPDIENFQFPILLNTNFFHADFFDDTAAYNKLLNEIKVNYILGNPPWKGNGLDKVGINYLKIREAREKSQKKKFKPAINNNELAEGFVLRVSDFCKKCTQIALIIRSSCLYNLGYKKEYSPFRQYLLEEYYIDKVFELAAVRHEVFEKSNRPAIAPAAVLFYRYANGEKTDNNIVQHISLKKSRFFSLFKIFTINRKDYNQVQQNKLKKYDWLWKVLVYGSYLDFNLIKRIKEEFVDIRQVLLDTDKIVQSTGLHSRSESLSNPKDITQIESLPLIKTSAVQTFYIDYAQLDILFSDRIDIIKDIRIYKKPTLLVREGLDYKTLKAICAISNKDVLFKDSITSIKPLSNQALKIMHDVAAIFSSSLFSYYAINTFASIGIERERAKNYNKFSLPYLELNVDKNIKKIETANQGIFIENKKTLVDTNLINNLKSSINSELQEIDNVIYKKLELSDAESSLIDYALRINLKMIVGNEKDTISLTTSLNFKDEFLVEYASTFLKRFKSKLSTNDRKFVIEIWHSKRIIGMFFKVIKNNKHINDIIWKEIKDDEKKIFALLAKFGNEKITNRLFVQKDIRGFEAKENYFYIFKPNERRLWHRAIGYLDVNEFAGAMLKSAKEGK